MANIRIPDFRFRQFPASNLERLTGLKPVVVRDWRRRGLIHPEMEKGEKGFHPLSIAALLFFKRLSDHGLGPKQFMAWEAKYAEPIFRYVVDDPAMWSTSEDWRIYHDEQEAKYSVPLHRYLIIGEPPYRYSNADSIDEIVRRNLGVATIIDLEAMARDLRDRFGEPIGSINWMTLEVGG